MPMDMRLQRLASTPHANDSQAPHSQPMRHSLGVLPSERSTDREAFETSMLHRYSAPSTFEREPTPALFAKIIPEHILMKTSISIAGVAASEDHCVYLLQVDTGFGGVQTIPKRYSEIRDFRAALLESLTKNVHCGHGPCAHLTQLSQLKFPHRRLRVPGFRSTANMDVAQTRTKSLERFLKAMLRVYGLTSRREMRTCNNSRCAMLALIQDFLEVTEPVVAKQDENPVAAEISVDYKVSVAKASQTMGIPTMRYSFPNVGSYDDKQSPLFAIIEDSEPVAASD
jgi:hypothetical protein